MTGNLNKRLLPPQAKRLVWLTKGEGEPCKQGETSTQSGCVPAEGEAKGKKREKRPKPTENTVTDVNRMIELQADAFEKAHGWKDGFTREGFIKNWKKTYRGLQADSEAVAKLSQAVEGAFAKYNIPKVPVFIRKQTQEEKAGGENAHWDDAGFVVLSQDALDEYKYRSQKRQLDDVRKFTVKEAYDDVIEGLVVHELGHRFHGADWQSPLQNKAREILGDPAKRKQVEKAISGYAATHHRELLAEAYTMQKHPDFDKLPDETKKLVSEILGEVGPKIPPTELTGKCLLFAPFKGFGRRRSVVTERSSNIVQPVPAPRPINNRMTLLVAIETGEIVGIRLFGVCPTIRRRS